MSGLTSFSFINKLHKLYLRKDIRLERIILLVDEDGYIIEPESGSGHSVYKCV